MVRDANGRNDSIRAKYGGRWLHSGSRELQFFNTRENHYMRLIKNSLLIQREISLQIYFIGIVYFFRSVQISSTLENNCAYTEDSFSFSGGRGCFSALLVSAVTQEYSSFISTNLSMFSFPIQHFFDIISR